MLWEVDVILHYFYEVLLATYLKGNFSIKKLVSHDPDIPNVDLAIILLSFNHLRRRIQRSPTMRFPEKWWVDRPSKITYFSHILKSSITYIMQKYILRFDITMNDIMIMHVLYSMTDLFEIFSHFLFIETDLFFETSVQIATTTVFHH